MTEPSTLCLGDLIAILEKQPQDKVVSVGFDTPHSWRGDYWELAFVARSDVTVVHMLEAARSAVGSTYHGYKGDDFTMGEWSPCHLVASQDRTGEDLGLLLLAFMLGDLNIDITGDQEEDDEVDEDIPVVVLAGSEDWISAYKAGEELDKRFPDQDADEFMQACAHNDPGPTGEHQITGFVLEERGCRDEEDWWWLVTFDDGSVWSAIGGCDYTGWDCQSSLRWYKEME